MYGGMRINEEGWKSLSERIESGQVLSNAQLVTLGMKHIIEVFYPVVRIAQRRWAASHNCPTPCLKSDKWVVDTFKDNKTKNRGFDHAMPMMMVKHGYPWYFVPESNVYFQVERGEHMIQRAVAIEDGWHEEYAMAGERFFQQLQQLWEGTDDIG